MNKWLMLVVLVLLTLVSAVGLRNFATNRTVASTGAPVPLTPFMVASTGAPVPLTPFSTGAPVPKTPF